MSKQAARAFMEKLNSTEALQQALLEGEPNGASTDLPALARQQGFDCDEAELHEAAAEAFGGAPTNWLGRTVEWRPAAGGGGMLAVLPAEGLDVRLTQDELDLVSAGSISWCEEPGCNPQSDKNVQV